MPDQQAWLIDRAIILARDGNHHDITPEQIDAILADRQALLDATISVIVDAGSSVI